MKDYAIVYLLDTFTFLSMAFQIVGVAALVTGTLFALYRFFFSNIPRAIDTLRISLGQIIVLSLEFFVAGDIIKTIVTPDYYDIGILSILVVIRTIITYFLNQELSLLHQEGKKG